MTGINAVKRAIVRTARRFKFDVDNQSEEVMAIATCSNCESGYNLFNPHILEEEDDLELCAICSLLDLVEVYETSANGKQSRTLN